MALRFDPWGGPPSAIVQPASHIHGRSSTIAGSISSARCLSQLSLSPRPRLKPCYDWVFSSATNVHVALDRSAFKEYRQFHSYVLTLSDHRRVHVEGIGCVELKIRRKPDSKESHTIMLNDVLHIPSWLCNIFSDIYFGSGNEYEHSWTNSGVQFSKQDDSELRPWGYTENFFSLDRLVLAKRHREFRSPMLEDRDREIFTVNVTWPQSQQDRWAMFLSQCDGQRLSRVISESGVSATRSHVRVFPGGDSDQNNHAGTLSRRATLSNINANIGRQVPGRRRSSLKATISGYNLNIGDHLKVRT